MSILFRASNMHEAQQLYRSLREAERWEKDVSKHRTELLRQCNRLMFGQHRGDGSWRTIIDFPYLTPTLKQTVITGMFSTLTDHQQELRNQLILLGVDHSS
jgi:hypothetical protein